MSSTSDEPQEPLHVLDMPQLYQKPSAKALIEALDLLVMTPTEWSTSAAPTKSQRKAVDDAGVPEYLTRIIASPLNWIADVHQRELIVDIASHRLSERSGRTGMSALTRSFGVALHDNTTEQIALHEPALTNDNLGFKTWGSAFVLANQLHKVDVKLLLGSGAAEKTSLPTILELGSGTGLVGLAAAIVWCTHVLMTDLPDIVPNLEHNAALNHSLLDRAGGRASSAVLDWSNPDKPLDANSVAGKLHSLSPGLQHFGVIIAADPIYDPSHPGLLVNAIESWAVEKPHPLCVLVAYPLRDAYLPQINELKQKLSAIDLRVQEEHRQWSRDDWKDDVLIEWLVWVR